MLVPACALRVPCEVPATAHEYCPLRGALVVVVLRNCRRPSRPVTDRLLTRLVADQTGPTRSALRGHRLFCLGRCSSRSSVSASSSDDDPVSMTLATGRECQAARQRVPPNQTARLAPSRMHTLHIHASLQIHPSSTLLTLGLPAGKIRDRESSQSVRRRGDAVPVLPCSDTALLT
jgi:hypothetical protein